MILFDFGQIEKHKNNLIVPPQEHTYIRANICVRMYLFMKNYDIWHMRIHLLRKRANNRLLLSE